MLDLGRCSIFAAGFILCIFGFEELAVKVGWKIEGEELGWGKGFGVWEVFSCRFTELLNGCIRGFACGRTYWMVSRFLVL